MKFETVNIKIDQLVKADYNPRRLTDRQFKDLRDSMTEFGSVVPAVINTHAGRENIIVGGHARVRVAQSLGMKEYPCVLVSLSLEKERELNIRLNKNVGEFDVEALANFFDASDLLDWGFSATELGISPDLGDSLEEPKEKKSKKCPHCGELLS